MKNLKSICKSPASWSVGDAEQRIKDLIALQKENMKLNFHIFAKPTALADQSGSEGPSTPKFIGCAGLSSLELFNHSATAGIIIRHQDSDSKYGTECMYLILQYAFESLNLHRVAFETSQENLPMRGWLEKAALVPLESVLKEALFDEGRYIDLCIYPILNSHWFNVTKPALEKRLIF